MIRTIKSGSRKPNDVHRFVCSHCGCTFYADSDDAKPEYRWTFENEVWVKHDDGLYCKCPECKHPVKEEKLYG